MKAQLELNTDSRIFQMQTAPCALRTEKSKDTNPKMPHLHSITYLDGVMEKYIPGDYEFDVPKTDDLYQRKSMVSMLKTEKCLYVS
jgi:hypothetical protein